MSHTITQCHKTCANHSYVWEYLCVTKRIGIFVFSLPVTTHGQWNWVIIVLIGSNKIFERAMIGRLYIGNYIDAILTTTASQITSLTIVYSTVYSGADQRKHQSSASLASVRVIHRGPVNSPHKWPVPRKMFPFDDVIMPRRQKSNSSLVHYDDVT